MQIFEEYSIKVTDSKLFDEYKKEINQLCNKIDDLQSQLKTVDYTKDLIKFRELDSQIRENRAQLKTIVNNTYGRY